MENLAVIIIAVVAGVIALVHIWYLFHTIYWKRKRDLNEKDELIKLDGKIELVKNTVLVAVAIAGIFGFYKLQDINSDLKRLDSLQSEYRELVQDHKQLLKQFDSMDSAFEQANERVSKFERSAYKLERDIQEASRKIPEENIKMLGEIFARAHISSVSTSGIWLDDRYNLDEKKEELKKTKELLKRLWFDDEEIDEMTKPLYIRIINEEETQKEQQ